jgi:xanthine dehydrogenase molybdenum-binding subunit
VKIIEAVRAAAEAGELRADAIRPAPERNNTLDVVGKSIPREEAYARVTGEEKYTADLRRPGMLHARALRSRYPHAKILRVDVERARIMPGVVAVMTAADVPGAKNHGMVQKDWPAIAYDKVRYIGDSIAIVAAETEAQAGAALEAIEVDYETLPVITSPEEGLAEGAERVHEGGNVLMHIQFGKGDIDSGFAESDLIVESTFRTPASEHAYLEPEASLAEPDPATGGVIVYVGSQVPFEDREDIAACLALPLEKVRVMHMPTGGAFGGKEDICCQVHAALLAVKTGRPVMMVLSRSESIRVHPKRHATVISLKTGVSRDGRVLAQKVRILGDTGAYASLGIPVMTRAATHSIGPYAVPNVAVECYAVFTNNPPAGAYRGFGVTQVHFAAESQMDIIAQRVGISPFDIRLINALDVGEATSTGQVLKESVGLRECLERLRESIPEAGSAMIGHRRAWGIAAAYKNVGLGNGLADTSEAIVGATQGGRVLVRAGAAEVGQGHDEVLRQIVAEVLGLGASDIDVVLGDTGRTPDSGATTASRHTFVTGNAAKRAANLLKDNLRRAAASALGVDPAALRFRGGRVFAEAGGVAGPSMNFENVVVSAIEQGISIEERYLYTPPKTVALGQSGDSHFSFGFGAQAALVDVDIESGEARVLEVVAAHDVGQAINPMAIEGQVEGGIVMGMGFALTERFVVEGGYVKSDSLAKYKIPDVSLTPKITSIIVEHPTSEGPFGAKGVGEITSIPTAPAIANAIYNAVGIRFYELPIDRMALKTALDAARSGAPL